MPNKRLTLICLLGLAGCSPAGDIRQGEAAVVEFRSRIARGDYSGIYNDAAAEFKASGTAQQVTELMAEIHRKLGSHASSSQTGFHVNYTTQGTILTLNYRSRFEHGEAEELFVFRVDGGSAQLIRYNVDSPALRGL